MNNKGHKMARRMYEIDVAVLVSVSRLTIFPRIAFIYCTSTAEGTKPLYKGGLYYLQAFISM